MKQFFRKPWRFACCYALLLACLGGLTLLDAFVIPRGEVTVDASQSAVSEAYQNAKLAAGQQTVDWLTEDTTSDDMTEQGNDMTAASSIASNEATSAEVAMERMEASVTASTEIQTEVSAEAKADATSVPIVTDTSYDDGEVSIHISTCERNGTTYYVADVTLASPESLMTAFAGGVYGRNVKAVTSEIAASVDAILAINGDYYGFRDTGYVLRNGVMYRSISGGRDALVIDVKGDFSIVNEDEVALSALQAEGAWQVLSFGPGLVVDGSVVVDENDEVSQSRTSNPRTAIGQVGENHYVLVVSDGRTRQSTGFTLLELAEVMQELGCETAYNLDGGGSSTMVFMGQVVNRPTSNGRSIQERSVSDIVAIGA